MAEQQTTTSTGTPGTPAGQQGGSSPGAGLDQLLVMVVPMIISLALVMNTFLGHRQELKTAHEEILTLQNDLTNVQNALLANQQELIQTQEALRREQAALAHAIQAH